MNRLPLAIGIVTVLLLAGLGFLFYIDHRPTTPTTATDLNLTQGAYSGTEQPTPTPQSPVTPQPQPQNIFQSIGQTISNLVNTVTGNNNTTDTNNNNNSANNTNNNTDNQNNTNDTNNDQNDDNNTNIDNNNNDQTPPPVPPQNPPPQNPPPQVNPPTPPPANNTQPSVATVDISNYKFATAIVYIHPGDSVKWINNDNHSRTITALNGSFDSGPISAGANYIHRFDSAGTYNYHNSFAPSMVGKIIVQ